MYPKYFGLKEPSFSIAPDPHYLFLSEQHKEALAHLLYGAGESGGFVLLTGEVGTGKTTVCRAFLEQLPEGVDVALIVNPALTANELLLGICDEFRIPVPPGERSVKLLVDLLNEFLLDAHARGRRPVLMIDEAQNLRPKVMEQVRLLTNLETTKHKLLQIFLVGQPELRRMLGRESLRQIDQRITARFHLRPLSPAETGDYIRHRVAVAGVDRPLFTAAAIRRIHTVTGGVPRLVNILCDRALLGACVSRASQVTPAIVAKAAREVRGEAVAPPPQPAVRPAYASAAALTLLLAAGWLGFDRLHGDPAERIAGLLRGTVPVVAGDPGSPTPGQAKDPNAGAAVTEPDGDSAVASADTPVAPAASADTKVVPGPSVAAGELPAAEAAAPNPAPVQAQAVEPDLAQAAAPAVLGPGAEPLPQVSLASLTPEAVADTLVRIALPEEAALRALLRHWGVTVQDLGAGDPCGRVAAFGLRCEREQGRLSNVRYFDRPVLLRVADQDGARRYLVLGALDETHGTLDLAEGSERVPVAAIEGVWSGDYTVVWQPPPTGASVIGPGASGESIRWLRQLLAQVPGAGLPDNASGRYDRTLSGTVRRLQSARGLEPDGIAGPRTLVQLQNAVAMAGSPRLMAPRTVAPSPDTQAAEQTAADLAKAPVVP